MRFSWFKCLLCLLASLTLASASSSEAQTVEHERWADNIDTLFEHYTQAQGLPQPLVYTMAESGDGFLWVGTQGGLARWDGYRFRSYKRDPGNQASLPDEWITVLHTDPKGRLWVGTSAGGLVRYLPDSDGFAPYSGLSNRHISAIVDDGKGGLWIGTDAGLDHIDPDTGHIESFHHDPHDFTSLPDERILAAVRSADGTLWLGTSAGLIRYDDRRFSLLPLPSRDGKPVSAWSLFADSDDRLWIGTNRQGAYSFDIAAKKLTPVKKGEDFGINAIAEVRPGLIWLASRGDGIYPVDAITGWAGNIIHDQRLQQTLAHNVVHALYRDHNGGMWVGTPRGLDHWVNDRSGIQTILASSPPDGSMSAPDIMSVMQASDGKIWIGFGNGGLDIVNPIGGHVDKHPADPAHPSASLPNDTVMTTAETPNGIYVGTMRGLFRTDLSGASFERIDLSSAKPDAPVNALLAYQDRLWIGGREDGLHVMPLSGGKAPVTDMAIGSQLDDQRIVSLLPKSPHEVWVGTLAGLNVVEIDKGTAHPVIADAADPQALMPGFVSTLLTDHKGRLWVGILGGGICVETDPSQDGKPRFRRLGLADGLPHLAIDKLLADPHGKIWASTADGIAVIDPDSFVVRALHKPDGVAITQYWVGSGMATPHGEVIFGGAGGLTVIRPNDIKDWVYRPPVAATDIRAGGLQVPAGRFFRAGAQPLVISPHANSLTVEFAALDYSAPDLNRYAYRLEGYDPDWIETDAGRRLAAYTNLPPGSYTLHLRGSNRNGDWSETPFDLPVLVLPAWYQTWWFRVFLGALAIACVTALTQIRTAVLLRRQRELEQQVAERTLSLEQRSAELARSNDALNRLGTLGQEITANLDAEELFASFHRHIGSLLEAKGFAVWLHEDDLLHDHYIVEDGKTSSAEPVELDDPLSPVAQAVRERRKITVEGPKGTAMFAPLLVGDNVIGVMSISTDRQKAYGTEERLIFRNFCAYCAVALNNANTYRELEELASRGAF